MSKAKVVGWVIASPFILIALGVAFCEANKAYWDHQVRLMCEKDGGVTVYEKVELTKEELKNLGGSIEFIRTPLEEYAKPEDIYISTNSHELIQDGYIQFKKHETKIFRRLDKSILSIDVSYSRSGGDFPTGIMHQSSFGCWNINKFNVNQLSRTFFVKGE